MSLFEFKVPKILQNKKIKTSFKEEVEPQEILLDALSQREDLFSQKKIEIPLKSKIFQKVSFLFFILLSFLFFKVFQLQIIKGVGLTNLAVSNYQRFYYARAERGVIYDSDFNQLVFNDLSFDLVCEPLGLPQQPAEKKAILKQVAEIIKEEPNLFNKKIEDNISSPEILVSENLDHETLILLETKIKDLPGFLIEENIKRKYLDGSIFSQIIGFIGRIEKQELKQHQDYSILDYIGKMGLEKQYEQILKGKKEKIAISRDASGKELSRQMVSEAENGKSLVLFLDSELQKEITQVLENTIKTSGAKAGAVIALEAQTGGILSLVSLPSFDNNIFFEKLSSEQWNDIFNDPKNPFWNRAISGTYPTGSTIKPLIGVASLEEKIISPTKNILCQGQITIDNPWYPDNPWIFHDWTVHGLTDLRKAIAQSCNVYFYTVGGGYGSIKGLGEQKIKKYLELFGWGHLTGIDLPGEKQGLIPSPEWKKQYFENETEKIWLPGDTYNLSIGQGYLSITPLQVISSFAALANNGKLLRPMIVKEIIDEQKNVIQKFEPEIIRENFIDADNLKIVRQGMRDAVIYGSSVLLNDLPVKAAAKTGTAQTGQKNYYHNWVTVFAPYDNPKIVLTVLIENVPEEQVAALPVAKEILQWYFSK